MRTGREGCLVGLPSQTNPLGQNESESGRGDLDSPRSSMPNDPVHGVRRPREPTVNSANMADAVVRVEFESEHAALLTSCLHDDMFLIFRDLLQAAGLPYPAMTTIILT